MWQLLTAAERRDLLWLARESIRSVLHGEVPPTLDTLTPTLCAPGAAFVSLHHHATLRGCIGTLLAEQPLHETVAHTARAAAFNDPRFAPLTAEELASIDIEISRLSPLRRACATDVRAGLHGVCLRFGEQRSIFLPQVATLYGWDRDTLLAELCRKAFLPADAWQRPEAELEIFEAEVFGEATDNRL